MKSLNTFSCSGSQTRWNRCHYSTSSSVSHSRDFAVSCGGTYNSTGVCVCACVCVHACVRACLGMYVCVCFLRSAYLVQVLKTPLQMETSDSTQRVLLEHFLVVWRSTTVDSGGLCVMMGLLKQRLMWLVDNWGS